MPVALAQIWVQFEASALLQPICPSAGCEIGVTDEDQTIEITGIIEGVAPLLEPFDTKVTSRAAVWPESLTLLEVETYKWYDPAPIPEGKFAIMPVGLEEVTVNFMLFN